MAAYCTMTTHWCPMHSPQVLNGAAVRVSGRFRQDLRSDMCTFGTFPATLAPLLVPTEGGKALASQFQHGASPATASLLPSAAAALCRMVGMCGSGEVTLGGAMPGKVRQAVSATLGALCLPGPLPSTPLVSYLTLAPTSGAPPLPPISSLPALARGSPAAVGTADSVSAAGGSLQGHGRGEIVDPLRALLYDLYSSPAAQHLLSTGSSPFDPVGDHAETRGDLLPYPPPTPGRAAAAQPRHVVDDDAAGAAVGGHFADSGKAAAVRVGASAATQHLVAGWQPAAVTLPPPSALIHPGVGMPGSSGAPLTPAGQ